MFPLWTPDGRDLVYMLRTPLGFCLARKAADGSGETTTFMEGGDMVVPNAVTPDGNTVIATIDSQETDFDIVSVSLEDPGASNVLVDNAGRQSQATLSNDGKWLAYVSNELGQPAIFVRPYPSLDGKWQVSTGVGREPLWAPNGKRLYYRDDDRVMAVDIETEPAFNAGEPYLLFEGAFHRDSTNVTYDRAPGEDRFLMIKPDAEPVAVTALTVVENWFEELKRLAPVPTGNWSTSN